MIRIVLAEDHTLIRQAAHTFLESVGAEVTSETAKDAEAIRLAHKLQLDVVIHGDPHA